MPIGFRSFRSIRTKLKLNGPKLRFTQDPQNATQQLDNTVVFTAEAIAEFPGAGVNADGGYGFSWYVDGNKLDPSSSSVTIDSGYARSTLTLSNIGVEDNKKLVYCEVDYLPAGKEGAALITPLRSQTAIITSFPEFQITKQPVNQSVGSDVFAQFSCDSEILPTTQPQDQEYQWQLDSVDLVDGVSGDITVSGAKTKDLSIKTSSDNFSGTVRCKISSSSIQVSPVFTDSATFQTSPPSAVLVLEAYDTINKLYKTSESYLQDRSVILNSDTFGSSYNVIQFFSKEGDFNFNLNVRASAGGNKGSFIGGEGGTSTIQINAKKQTEYTILGISNNSSVFIYEKARLIACIGQGGEAGTEGNGGDGGGVNVDGSPGVGRNPGLGGERPVTGTLDLNGSYGSVMSGATISLYDGDTIQSQQNGGQTLSCTKGSYYINQGFSPCEDVSSELIQFVDNSGSTYTDSDELFRGFKSGYTITDTAGASADDASGRGGNGATGGNGGSNRSGGGGGSGYIDDSVVVVSTSVGGNKDQVSEITFSV